MDVNEQIISDFLQQHYTDERLSWLLAHAESGQLSYNSCCCFVGIATADHALRGAGPSDGVPHYELATKLEGAYAAEVAYLDLGFYVTHPDAGDEVRRTKLIPLIKSEIQRREGLLNLKAALVELGETLQEVSV